jgi:hypothetical protein
MKLSQSVLLLGIGLFSAAALANGGYPQQMDRNAPEASGSYQQQTDRSASDENYPQQVDHNAPEGTEGELNGGPGDPHAGPDGTEYPSNNLQNEDPE